MYLSSTQYAYVCLTMLVLLVAVGGLMLYFLRNRPEE
ncbi:hypothetical protein Slin_6122 [Spirosoma linguale DSM 74]|uniref:Uncharacterized protein n=1 Tax=Spirosoma linguale (strain ATCC 33905 / DSM 74 / LMG 10896 / Claus 1) TaxID=504472 RepID=D2QTF1_SPILD|nr:hypothetical protein Slin_6122 [Spirosoma linguale DSM 74]